MCSMSEASLAARAESAARCSRRASVWWRRARRVASSEAMRARSSAAASVRREPSANAAARVSARPTCCAESSAVSSSRRSFSAEEDCSCCSSCSMRWVWPLATRLVCSNAAAALRRRSSRPASAAAASAAACWRDSRFGAEAFELLLEFGDAGLEGLRARLRGIGPRCCAGDGVLTLRLRVAVALAAIAPTRRGGARCARSRTPSGGGRRRSWRPRARPRGGFVTCHRDLPIARRGRVRAIADLSLSLREFGFGGVEFVLDLG
jgi:hypothetical protein